jgi:hypothetical protein
MYARTISSHALFQSWWSRLLAVALLVLVLVIGLLAAHLATSSSAPLHNNHSHMLACGAAPMPC